MRLRLRIALGALLLAHTAAGLASFLAPYDPAHQHRDFPWAPPSLARMSQVSWLSPTTAGLKLFSPREAVPVFVLGTDGLGRDQFSRLLHGARISLFSGVAAGGVSALLGLLLGGIAGFAGGATDRLIMRVSEMFLSLPWMYLLLAARAFLPLDSDPRLVFVTLLLVLGAVGWARPARLVRGIVLSAMERDYVLASAGFGARPTWILRHHILPETYPAVLTYMTVAIPQYVTAEATLSFLGLGFSSQTPGWGGLIAALGSLEVLASYWWMWAPAVALTAVLACYFVVSSSLSVIH
ncbi:MAG: ABC transporter permease [Bryobacteraceae bacterium]|nr:ABC transporter permease [Bryobacteraceae bacterium]